MRCVFSEPLNRNSVAAIASPAGPPGRAALSRDNRWRAVVRVLRSPRILLDDLVTTIFPANCRSCQGPLQRAGSVPVCDACVGHLVQTRIIGCHQCGEAIDISIDFEDQRFAASVAASLLCRDCRLAAPDFTRAVSFGLYDRELRDLIHLLKFEHVGTVARLLGSRLAQTIAQLKPVAANDLLVIAVPLFRQRERERGYNQSTLLATAALRQLRRTHPNWHLTAAHRLLQRKRSTESSFVLSRRGRRRNLKGAFRVTGDVLGREILLIDDILTTGATVRECARVLIRAGASKVWVATLARAQKGTPQRLHEDPGEDVAHWDLPITSPA